MAISRVATRLADIALQVCFWRLAACGNEAAVPGSPGRRSLGISRGQLQQGADLAGQGWKIDGSSRGHLDEGTNSEGCDLTAPEFLLVA